MLNCAAGLENDSLETARGWELKKGETLKGSFQPGFRSSSFGNQRETNPPLRRQWVGAL